MSGCLIDDIQFLNKKNNGSLSPIIKTCINRIAQEEDLQDCGVEVQDISTDGGNYMATLQTINIKGKTETGNKDISLFVKNKLRSIEGDIIELDTLYERESYYYSELSKIYDELQVKAKIPANDRLRKAKSYNESNSEAIILENLSKKGYKTRNRLEPMSRQFAEIALIQLAKFHALSFVLQQKNPEYYNTKIKPFSYPVNFTEEWADYLKNMCSSAVDCLDGDLKVGLEKFKEKIVQVYENFIHPSSEQATCLCHGDFRANNILVKEVDGDIKDLIVVDYQTMRYGSPATDFIYFIFTGTDQKFRRAHLHEMKELYYETLGRFLSNFGIKVYDVYSKKRFEQEYRDFLDVGLVLLLMAAPFLFCSDDNVPDLQKESLSTINFSFEDAESKKRLLGIVEDYMQWGYL